MPVDVALANRCVALLNEVLEKDPELAECLVEGRFPCNDAIAEHPTIQVGLYTEDGKFDNVNGVPRVGILGILNGLCGAYDDGPMKDCGAVCAEFETGLPDGSMPLNRFKILENKEKVK